MGAPDTALRLAVPLLAAALCGCIDNDDRRAGVDEFPNSIYARVNGFLGESKKSDEIGVPALGDSLQSRSGFAVAAAKPAARKLAAAQEQARLPALGKIAAGAGCQAAVFTYSDSIPSLIPPKLYAKDTLLLCMDGKFLTDSQIVIRGKSVSVYAGGRVETSEVSDADGDGILNPAKGGGSKASLILTALENGVLEKTLLTVGPGPDNDFATEPDNLIYELSWTRMRGTDTLARAGYADADSDGVAVDNGKASVVDVELYQKGPSAEHPDAVWSRARLRLVALYHQDAKEARGLSFEMEDTAGRFTSAEVLGMDGGSLFDMRDTVIAHFTTVGAASDSLDTLDVGLRMRLGASFSDKADDQVYAIHAVSTRKLGDERRAAFDFVSSKPVPSGAAPEDGTLSLSIAYRDGTELTLEGTLEAKALDAIIVDRQGKRFHAVWDAQGRTVLVEAVK